VHVLVDETRPRLQGARLTAWELEQYKIPYEIISDGAAGFFLRSGQVQRVFSAAIVCCQRGRRQQNWHLYACPGSQR